MVQSRDFAFYLFYYRKAPHFLRTDEVGSLVRGKALLLTERRAFALGSEVASSYKTTALP
ncbi:hypothetical protein [Riemerella anatipestifer]|uniref:hypothetical protein n=1 Tax=Riemerella anatipestifer TaxID=34085 RepID=UPI00129D7581|nr:hypothetical protein [Riemerella anatipestifer]MBT0552456.1 hypothetical protein [Riemerella anatipestifer]MBT0554769.1 hypothetical protein [Riemerella anatipestifer]MBT0565071.1 hypothetical protein [Riemerella anatipestifer]MCE3025346.1 hypothetical protein [Riemerella anatipestifer]MCU7543011.1 hypothetical protein [Riemerella anatipestifer]